MFLKRRRSLEMLPVCFYIFALKPKNLIFTVVTLAQLLK